MFAVVTLLDTLHAGAAGPSWLLGLSHAAVRFVASLSPGLTKTDRDSSKSVEWYAGTFVPSRSRRRPGCFCTFAGRPYAEITIT